VLPEDDADRQLANGFLLAPGLLARSIQVLPKAGGWGKVLDLFQSEHVRKMDANPGRYMVLLIDFDHQEDRLGEARAVIPTHLKDRVFVLGVWSEPEKLKADLGRPAYESIGEAMAKDCREGTDTIWSHDLLRHNAEELGRLRQHVRPILFPPA
jgi:hypothetical protein